MVTRSLIVPSRLVKDAEKRGHKVNRKKTAVLREVFKPRDKPSGTWIDDLVSLRKALVLCWFCKSKFDHKRNRYYKDQKFPCVQGKCDGCGRWDSQSQLYVHESFLSDPNGRTRHGQCWTPR